VREEETYPLPSDPDLADVAVALRESGHWAWIVDSQWQLVFASDEIRRTFGGGQLASMPVGKGYLFGPEWFAASREWAFGTNTDEINRMVFARIGGLALSDMAGGRDQLRELIDPALHDLVDALEPVDADAAALARMSEVTGLDASDLLDISLFLFRIRDDSGRLAGTAVIAKPSAGMHAISMMVAHSDAQHLMQIQLVAKAARRPAAVLFADLEGSSPLARRLSTADYFKLTRRLVTAADRCVIEAGGLVGRHVGDGVVAFFLAETLGSESQAARACIAAARKLRSAAADVATRCGLGAEDVVIRFGLHWGSTLYVGAITTGARSEVTALGDEVNEGARIEACASGGRTLASKDLIERLTPADARALDLDPDHMSYTALGDLPTATEKARRDAPAIAVCDV
jgi:class 3 adenylate cyclase